MKRAGAAVPRKLVQFRERKKELVRAYRLVRPHDTESQGLFDLLSLWDELKYTLTEIELEVAYDRDKPSELIQTHLDELRRCIAIVEMRLPLALPHQLSLSVLRRDLVDNAKEGGRVLSQIDLKAIPTNEVPESTHAVSHTPRKLSGSRHAKWTDYPEWTLDHTISVCQSFAQELERAIWLRVSALQEDLVRRYDIWLPINLARYLFWHYGLFEDPNIPGDPLLFHLRIDEIYLLIPKDLENVVLRRDFLRKESRRLYRYRLGEIESQYALRFRDFLLKCTSSPVEDKAHFDYVQSSMEMVKGKMRFKRSNGEPSVSSQDSVVIIDHSSDGVEEIKKPEVEHAIMLGPTQETADNTLSQRPCKRCEDNGINCDIRLPRCLQCKIAGVPGCWVVDKLGDVVDRKTLAQPRQHNLTDPTQVLDTSLDSRQVSTQGVPPVTHLPQPRVEIANTQEPDRSVLSADATDSTIQPAQINPLREEYSQYIRGEADGIPFGSDISNVLEISEHDISDDVMALAQNSQSGAWMGGEDLPPPPRPQSAPSVPLIANLLNEELKDTPGAEDPDNRLSEQSQDALSPLELQMVKDFVDLLKERKITLRGMLLQLDHYTKLKMGRSLTTQQIKEIFKDKGVDIPRSFDDFLEAPSKPSSRTDESSQKVGGDVDKQTTASQNQVNRTTSVVATSTVEVSASPVASHGSTADSLSNSLGVRIVSSQDDINEALAMSTQTAPGFLVANTQALNVSTTPRKDSAVHRATPVESLSYTFASTVPDFMQVNGDKLVAQARLMPHDTYWTQEMDIIIISCIEWFAAGGNPQLKGHTKRTEMLTTCAQGLLQLCKIRVWFRTIEERIRMMAGRVFTPAGVMVVKRVLQM